ncbi:MAG: sulfotransferase domain-containing protein [Pseudomonadota bacterium]
MKSKETLCKKQNTKGRETIVIVSGLPRSGTSMMMKMLEAGGLHTFTDNIRVPDEDNPKGYYEFERVKQLDKENAWLSEAKGKVVKVISMLLKHLPPDYAYKVIFMLRDMKEVLASQQEMLIRRGKPGAQASPEEMANYYRLHLQKVEGWLAQQPNFDVLYVHYNEVLQNYHAYSKRINAFLGGNLNVDNMAGNIDHTLYRQRKVHELSQQTHTQ